MLVVSDIHSLTTQKDGNQRKNYSHNRITQNCHLKNKRFHFFPIYTIHLTPSQIYVSIWRQYIPTILWKSLFVPSNGNITEEGNKKVLLSSSRESFFYVVSWRMNKNVSYFYYVRRVLYAFMYDRNMKK